MRIALVVAAAATCAASVLVVFAFALFAVPAWVLLAMGTSFDSPPATPPLSGLSVERHHGRTTQVHATLARGYRLSDLVDLRLFDGFQHPEPIEEATRRVGPPTGYWRAPHAGADGVEKWFRGWGVDAVAPYYDRPLGRVTLRPYRTPEAGIFGMPVAYPKDCSLASFFKNPQLRAQIIAVLPETGLAALNIHASDGWGGFEVSLGRAGCTDISLGWRD